MKNLFTIKLLAFAMAGLFAQSAYSFGFDDLKNLDLDKLINIAKTETLFSSSLSCGENFSKASIDILNLANRLSFSSGLNSPTAS